MSRADLLAPAPGAQAARPGAGARDTDVAVIVPCHGYGRFLRSCVDSVLGQDGVAVRVLVIDDASPDDTAEVAQSLVREDDRVQLRRHAVNRGHIHTYNEGLRWAVDSGARALLLLSADDWLLPGALARAMRLLKSHPEVGFVFGRARIAMQAAAGAEGAAAAEGQTLTFQPWPEPLPGLGRGGGPGAWRVLSGPDFIEACGARNCVPTPTAVVRCTVQARTGGYEPTLPHTADMHMWLRLAAEAGVGVLADEQAVYRCHAANMSSAWYAGSRLPDLQARRAALEAFLADAGAQLPQAARLRRHLRLALARDALSAASGAFNAGQRAASAELERLALDASADVRRTGAWLRWRTKRAFGPTWWHRLGLDRLAQARRQRREAA